MTGLIQDDVLHVDEGGLLHDNETDQFGVSEGVESGGDGCSKAEDVGIGKRKR